MFQHFFQRFMETFYRNIANILFCDNSLSNIKKKNSQYFLYPAKKMSCWCFIKMFTAYTKKFTKCFVLLGLILFKKQSTNVTTTDLINTRNVPPGNIVCQIYMFISQYYRSNYMSLHLICSRVHDVYFFGGQILRVWNQQPLRHTILMNRRAGSKVWDAWPTAMQMQITITVFFYVRNYCSKPL